MTSAAKIIWPSPARSVQWRTMLPKGVIFLQPFTARFKSEQTMTRRRILGGHDGTWYDGGKSDPDLVLLRLDPESAKIWLSGSGIGMAIKSLLGNVKDGAKGQLAIVSLTAKQ